MSIALKVSQNAAPMVAKFVTQAIGVMVARMVILMLWRLVVWLVDWMAK
jgi:hypothetical protein